MMRRSCLQVIVGLLAVTLALAGCRNTDDTPAPPIGGATPTPTPTPTPSPTPDDPFAIPTDGVDEAYAERVINELLRISEEVNVNLFDYEPGESLREEDRNRLLAVYAGEQFILEVGNRQEIAMDQDMRKEVLLPIDERTGARFVAERVLHWEEACILVAGFYDLRGSLRHPPHEPDDFTLFSLSPKPHGQSAPTDVNPTPWQIRDVLEMSDPDGNAIPREAWDDLDFPDFLDRTCQEA